MAKCEFCGAEGEWPNICLNTRDIEDTAVLFSGTEKGAHCLAALRDTGLGEIGYERVVEFIRVVGPAVIGTG